MKKICFIKILASLLIATTPLLSSCSFFTEALHEPVKDYFKEYTENSAVTSYKINSDDYLKDSRGNICIPSYKDVSITLYLRNPQGFAFTRGSNMTLTFDSLDNEKVETMFGAAADTSLVTISQDADDKTILTITYPSEFLSSTETGFNITPYIKLRHPFSNANFGTYSALTLISNSPPPPIYGAVVYTNTAKNTYVICFNMPSKGLLKEIHKDIKTLEINGASYNIAVDSDGAISFDSEKLKTGDLSSSYTQGSAEFVAQGQPALFLTGDALSDKNTEYTLTLKDEAGLSSTVQTSVYSVRLGDITVKDKSGSVISSGSKIEQDENSSFATVTFTPAATATDTLTGQTYDTSDSQIVYEIYQGTDDTGKVLYNGKNSGGELTLKLPSGEIFTRIYAHKNLFADSKPQVFRLSVLKTLLYVSASGSDTENNGSETSPFKTIANTLAQFTNKSAANRLIMLTDIEESSDISIKDTNVTISGGKTITGNISINGSSSVTMDSTQTQGSIEYNSGNLTLKGTAKVSGGGITLQGGLAITAGTLTQSSVATITPKSYTEGTGVLMQADGVSSVTDELCSKFSVTSQTSGSNPTYYWAVVPSTDNTKGVLKKQIISAKILTPVENNYKTILLNKTKKTENYNYFIYGDTVSFKMTDSGGNTITPDSGSAYLAILQNGNTITSQTASGTEYPELTVPSYLPAERYELYTKAAINGETFCSTKQIYILSKLQEITKYSDLTDLKNEISSGSDRILVRLKNDIPLEDDWKYMCAESTSPFNGVFDGGGHTITVPKCSVTDDAEYAVLFGHIGYSGIVENLVIKSTDTAGISIEPNVENPCRDISVFAICNYGTIRNCTNRINLTGKTTTVVAGICARNRGLIENCLNAGNITNTSDPKPHWAGVYCIVGGITAYNGASIPGTIKNCYNSGTITAESDYETEENINGVPGAICGNIANNSSVEYSYWNEDCVKKSSTTLNCVAYKSSNHDGILGSAAGCGSVASDGTTITAGTKDNCGSEQTLMYGTSLQEALNGWIDAQTVPGNYKRWEVTGNGPELIYE